MVTIILCMLSAMLLLFVAGCDETETLAPNHPPEIQSIGLLGNGVEAGRFDTLVCLATDEDNDSLSYIWTAPAGLLAGTGDTVFWLAPDEVSEYPINCRVEDGRGGYAEANFNIQVFSNSFQTEYEWTHFNRNNSGLPSNYLWEVAITHNDIIWVLDEFSDVSRFDGASWQTWDVDVGDGSTLDIDSQGNAWIASSRYYITKIDGFTTSQIPLDQPAYAIAIDKQNHIWLGGATLSKFDGTSWTYYDTSNSGLPFPSVRAIAFDNNNELWCESEPGTIVHFDGNIWTIHENISTKWVNSISFDSDNNVWAGLSMGGIAIYDHIKWTTIQSLSPWGWDHPLVIDNNNNVWSAHGKTLEVLDGQALIKFGVSSWRAVFTTDNSPLPTGNITDIALDSKGNLWGTTYDPEDWSPDSSTSGLFKINLSGE